MKKSRTIITFICVLLVVVFTQLRPMAAADGPTSPGELDLSFGTDGFASTLPTATIKFNAMLVQPDDKSVLVGVAGDNILVMRLLTDGQADNSFGFLGMQLINLGGKGYLFSNGVGTAVAQQSDGKLIIGGHGESSVNGNYQWVMLRFNLDGTLDNTFAGDGILTLSTTTSDILADLALRPNNQILAGGGYLGGSGDTGLRVAQVRTDGQLDSNFSGDGTWETPTQVNLRSQLALQSNGQLLIGGGMQLSGRPSADLFLMRLNTNGNLDMTFGTSGIAWYDDAVGDEGLSDMLVQPDGKVVLVGSSTGGSTIVLNGIVVRLKANGTPDQEFGSNGKTIINISNYLTYGTAIVRDSNGQLIIAGHSIWAGTVSGDFTNSYVTRLNADGSLDSDFASNGSLIYDVAYRFTNGNIWRDEARAVGVQADGKIVAAGWVDAGASDYGYAMRLVGRYSVYLPFIIR